MKKIIWITGAGKGIGKAVALLYAEKGWSVAISSRTENDLIEVREEAQKKNFLGDIKIFTLDVKSLESYQRIYSSIRSELGDPDQIIFNAGTHIPSPVEAFDVDIYRELIETNYFGTINGISAVLPRLLEARNGHIAVVASVAGYFGLPNASAYGASKAALINLCESLRMQLDDYGITISVVNPGFVRTPLTDLNEFKMPFLMEPDIAARKIYEGMYSKKFEIIFPNIFVFILKTIRILPYYIFFPLIKKFTKT